MCARTGLQHAYAGTAPACRSAHDWSTTRVPVHAAPVHAAPVQPLPSSGACGAARSEVSVCGRPSTACGAVMWGGDQVYAEGIRWT
jgi:hypothetical protein